MLAKDEKRRIIAEYEAAVNEEKRALAALLKARANRETVVAYATMKGVKLPRKEKVSVETGVPGRRRQEVNETSNAAPLPSTRKAPSGLPLIAIKFMQSRAPTPISVAQLREAFAAQGFKDLHPKTAPKVLQRLKKQGLVDLVSRNGWVLTKAGLELNVA